jgi:Reverse transcriptase (RNA-dependent DNA polymerase)
VEGGNGKQNYSTLAEQDIHGRGYLPPGRKTVKCKWVFKIKYNPNGMINKYKARLVAQGDMQKADLDFKKTYMPVVQMNSTRLLLAITTQLNLFTLHIDISNAYLYGKMDIDIYMTQPLKFINTRHPDYIYLLNKSLYSIKQTGRIWHATIQEHILEIGFTSSTADPCIFVKELEKLIALSLHCTSTCTGLE